MSTPQLLRLPQRLDREFDRMIIKKFREWEKLEHKIAAHQNHLHFTLHCKHHAIFPPSLKLKCSMKGKGVDYILNKAQKQLTNERITRINRQLDYFNNLKTDIDEYLFTNLPGVYYDEIKQWMAHAHRSKFDNIRSRQQQKFQKLSERQKRTNPEENTIINIPDHEKNNIQDKWVVNLSNRSLTEDETSLLKKGLNFAITPITVPINDYVIGIESACKLLGYESKLAESLRSECVKTIKTAKMPHPNISKGQCKALHTLAKDNNITILPADKGRSIVILNTDDYKEKARKLLSDPKTYKILKKDPTPKYTTTLVKKLQELKNTGAITDITYRRLYPTSATIPRFYGLPKVHKSGAPLRPIVASRGSITYAVARHIRYIGPTCRQKWIRLKKHYRPSTTVLQMQAGRRRRTCFLRCYSPVHTGPCRQKPRSHPTQTNNRQHLVKPHQPQRYPGQRST